MRTKTRPRQPDPAPARGDAGEADERPALDLVDVHAGYGMFGALFGVSLRIGRGEALAVLGHNGMGKTTIARVASGLVVPTRGRVHVRGLDLTGRDAHDFQNGGVAHAPEGRSVFATLTVEENLTLPFRKRFGRSGVTDALQRVYTMFPRLGDRRTQLAGSLSGGEQRMLTLSRAMVLEPDVLIADELSLGLAPIITDEVYRVLGEILATGTSLLVIEQHTQHALALAHRAVIIDRGTVAFSGTPADVDAHYAGFAHRG